MDKDCFKWEMVPYTRGEGAQINPQDGKYFPHFLGVGAGKLRLFAGNAFDFAVADDLTETTIDEVWRVVRPNGYMLVIDGPKDDDPEKTFFPIQAPSGGWDLVSRFTPDGTLRYMLVYKKTSNGQQRHSWKDAKPDLETACVVRYGAVGDMIQTSSVLACLREQGYHVTLMTHSGTAYEVVKHDPNVDEFILQDKDQVPNDSLGPFWTHWMKKYDRFINLSGSVESTWLAIEHHYSFYWPQPVRHHYLNENYLEFMHRLAGVPLKYRPRFYPTADEKAWAKKQKNKLGAEKVILWALAGSSTHKAWPYMDHLIARILLQYPGYKIVLVGDEFSAALETGWENEPRVIKRAGRWTYRESLAFAVEAADLAIGPETGILNAVSMLDVPKILFLSHSGANNLCRDWVNCQAMEPEGCRCFPCHLMHAHGFAWCERDEHTGAALCQAKIDTDQAWGAFVQQMRGFRVN